MAYKQRTGMTVMEMYVEGVSTRNVREITEVLCGTTFSKSLVSELAGQLDEELEAWRKRPLTETTYPYLSVDARYEHVRQGGHAAQRAPGSQGVLIVAGVRADGHREILAVAVVDTESEAMYHQVFRDLKARGLSGVRLVTSDAHKGLKAAIDQHFQGASWEPTHPAVARMLEEAIEDCFACLAFPLAHRARIRTTNGLERLNEEIKRRTRVVPGALWADSRTPRLVCGS